MKFALSKMHKIRKKKDFQKWFYFWINKNAVKTTPNCGFANPSSKFNQYILNDATKKTIRLLRKGGAYILRMWIQDGDTERLVEVVVDSVLRGP